MQKKLAIIFAFFIVFAPVYSNAVLPALAATVASNSGRVLVGQTIKKVAPSAIANARKALVGICQKNPNYCRGAGAALGLKLISDGWNIDVTNNDVTNDIDVDIYKIPQGETCITQVSFSASHLSAAVHNQSIINYYESQNTNGWYKYRQTPNYLSPYQAVTDYWSKYDKSQLTQNWQKYGQDITVTYDKKTQSGDLSWPDEWQTINTDVGVYVRCVPWSGGDKIYINDSDLNQYITNNNINDIDVLDIYNFDFSQYNNINIGGDTYNGTTINNDLAKSDPTEADKKVSADLKKKLDSKELSLDDVTDENCTKNESGEYDKCGADKEPDPDNPEEPEQPTESPIECDANGFYKKVCDWMDWTQKEPKPSTSESVDVKDVEAENSNKIDMAGECPAPYELNFSVLGYEQNHSISYEPLCGALVLLKPIFVGSGALSGMFILMGYSRASNTGVNG